MTVKEPTDPSAAFERIAWLMDRAIKIPGTQISFGLDALLELLPGLGDAAATLIQGALVFLIAVRFPALPKSLIARMALNVAVDSVVGTVPLFGDAFDAYFKANTRNVRLLRAASAEHLRTGHVKAKSHTLFLVCVGVGLCLVAALVFALGLVVAKALLTAVGALN